MNCNDMEKLILLSQSGELSHWKRRRLELHLAACAECKTFEAETVRLTAATREAAAIDCQTLPAEVLRDILRKAGRRADLPETAWIPALRPLLALAAGLGLIVGILSLPTLRSPRAPGHHSAHNGMGDLSSLLTLMIGTDQEDTELAPHSPASLNRSDMAHRILLLQGMNVETPEPDLEETTLPEEIQPTTLQWHSSPGVPFERCG